MKLKVKIRDTTLTIDTVHINAEGTVQDLIATLIEKNLAAPEVMHDLTIKGYEDIEKGHLRLSTLFCTSDKAYLSNTHISITLTMKAEAETLANQTLLDYSKVVQAVEKYDEALAALAVRPGTVFFVQQEADQYLLRRELWGIEVFHFRTQYEEAFQEAERTPIVTIELKSRDALTKDELKWVRTIMFPSRHRRNPLIRLNHPPISQAHIDVIATLIHRMVVIMGKFEGTATHLESNDAHLPTYVQLGVECSIGYIEKAQLEGIR
ncbi:hypothetical protein [Salinicoccus bachuensis]|uniref:Uncharacterized protein n=1 Tax=Salinicoccus bachuensis TaxID=3136731 RepID=A0ABZ3CK80_9STAP